MPGLMLDFQSILPDPEAGRGHGPNEVKTLTDTDSVMISDVERFELLALGVNSGPIHVVVVVVVE